MKSLTPNLCWLAIVLSTGQPWQCTSEPPQQEDTAPSAPSLLSQPVLVSREDHASAIYGAVIDHFYRAAPMLVISDKTSADYAEDPRMLARVISNLRKDLPALDEEAVRDFQDRAKRHEPLQNRFRTHARCVLI